MTSKASPILGPRHHLAEGVIWDHRVGRFYWVDILSGELFSAEIGGHAELMKTFDGYASGVWLLGSADLLVAAKAGLLRLDPQTGQTEPVSDLAPPADMRFNDGAVDASGRLFVGVIVDPPEHHDHESAPISELYCVEPGGKATKVLGDLTIANGIDWSPDGQTMYFVDSISRRIYLFDMTQDLDAFKDPSRFFDLGDRTGVPDGLTVDSDGFLYVAAFFGSEVLKLSADGEVVETLPLEASCPTCPAFGGKDLSTLVVTTSYHALENEQAEPLAGRVFQCTNNSRGKQSFVFGSGTQGTLAPAP